MDIGNLTRAEVVICRRVRQWRGVHEGQVGDPGRSLTQNFKRDDAAHGKAAERELPRCLGEDFRRHIMDYLLPRNRNRDRDRVKFA